MNTKARMPFEDLVGTPEEIEKATVFRARALKRTPSIWFLLDELTDAKWWIENKMKFHHAKIWCDLLDDPQERNEFWKWINDELWGPNNWS